MHKKRLLIIDPVKSEKQSYIQPVIDAFKDTFEVATLYQPTSEKVKNIWNYFDLIWVDWCTELAVLASQLNEGKDKELFIRVHAFEVLEGDFAKNIKWGNVNGLVAVSKDVLRLLSNQVQNVKNRTEVYIIPNGIDKNVFAPNKNFDPMKIIWVGVMSPKKNPFVSLHLLKQLLSINERYELHVAGEVSNLRCFQHFNYLTDSLGLKDHVRYYNHILGIRDWYEGKGILVSTSLYESFGYAIAESLACGLDAVVFDFPNARELWPESIIVKTMDEALFKIQHPKFLRYSEYVQERYPLAKQINDFKEIINKHTLIL